MGSSRNSSSGELPERAAAVLAPAIFPGAHLAMGLSGGVDSVALLSALIELAPAMRFSLRAVHLNHGISPNAARWAEFCARLCAGFRIPLQLETVDMVLTAISAWRVPHDRLAMRHSPAWTLISSSSRSIAMTKPRRCCCAFCAGRACEDLPPCLP